MNTHISWAITKVTTVSPSTTVICPYAKNFLPGSRGATWQTSPAAALTRVPACLRIHALRGINDRGMHGSGEDKESLATRSSTQTRLVQGEAIAWKASSEQAELGHAGHFHGLRRILELLIPSTSTGSLHGTRTAGRSRPVLARVGRCCSFWRHGDLSLYSFRRGRAAATLRQLQASHATR